MNQTARVRVVEAGSIAISPRTVTQKEHDLVLEKLRQCEAEKVKIIKDHGTLMKEFNRRMQVHIEEIRLLKEVNQKLQADMQELRDLCCYLDDDRHKCRKLAREWQRFGRYTATVMRNEVTAYQEKLHTLEFRQNDVSTNNNELKELCLYLDQQRQNSCNLCSKCSNGSIDSQSTSSINRTFSGVVPRGPGYSEKLEARLSNIGTEIIPLDKIPEETNGRGSKKRVSFSMPDELTETDTDSLDSRGSNTMGYAYQNGIRDKSQTGILRNGLRPFPKEVPFPSNSKMKPEAVAQAMKVLEIHERLEHQALESNAGKEDERLDESEVAVLKEMCNVVWRKLSNGEEVKAAAMNGSNGTGEDDVLEDLL